MEYQIIIPDNFFSVFKFYQENKLGVAAINTALRGLEHKFVFGWHLSLMVHFDKVEANGLPSEARHKTVEEFEKQLNETLNPVKKKPNALFLGRITWNGTAELIWRVHSPEETDSWLRDILRRKEYPFPFDYRMDPDGDWDLAKWHLKVREYNIGDN